MSFVLAGIYLTILALTLLTVSLGVRHFEEQRRNRLRKMLQKPEVETGAGQTSVLIERVKQDSTGARLDQMLSGFNFPKKWEARIQQAGLTWTVPQLLAWTAVGAVVGVVGGLKIPILLDPIVSAVGVGCLFAMCPWIYINHKRSVRLAQFEEQFPEALDFIGRALRSGHAFPVSLAMLSQESPQPLRSEFLKVYNEQNLGAALPVVLMHLADRVPLVDVRFFVSAVLMQRETGGNLGEILTRLAYVIRERFRLKGQVKAASAHGRITATILTVLPIITVLILTLIAPGYLPSMARDPDGKWLIVAGVAGQIIGYFVMRRIINIKV